MIINYYSLNFTKKRKFKSSFLVFQKLEIILQNKLGFCQVIIVFARKVKSFIS